MSCAFRVLTVEDNEIVSVILSILLAGAGFTVCSTASSEEAVRALDSQSFDLMLIDIQMPKTDGFRLLERLRADNRYARIPALMLTASDDILDVRRARDLGARGFLSKPFGEHDLTAKVRRILRSPEIAWIDDHHCLLQPVPLLAGSIVDTTNLPLH